MSRVFIVTCTNRLVLREVEYAKANIDLDPIDYEEIEKIYLDVAPGAKIVISRTAKHKDILIIITSTDMEVMNGNNIDALREYRSRLHDAGYKLIINPNANIDLDEELRAAFVEEARVMSRHYLRPMDTVHCDDCGGRFDKLDCLAYNAGGSRDEDYYRCRDCDMLFSCGE